MRMSVNKRDNKIDNFHKFVTVLKTVFKRAIIDSYLLLVMAILNYFYRLLFSCILFIVLFSICFVRPVFNIFCI